MKPIVTFFGTQPYEQESFDALNRDFGFEFRYFKGHLSRQTVVATHGAQAACIFVNDTADAEVMRELARNGVRLLALRCAGYNNVDLEAARTFNIPVVRVPAYSPHAVAEYTVAMMLSLNRKIPRASWRTRDGNFSLQGLMGFDMNGKTVGVIGTGKIARIVIRILLGFGMEVLAYDPYPDGVFARETGIAYVSLDELYRRSDIITLHCPLTNETKHLVNETSIARMKRGVMIVNTGRGQLIQTEALIEALKSKQVGGAGRLRGGRRLLLRRPVGLDHRRRHAGAAAALPQCDRHVAPGLLHGRGDAQHHRDYAAKYQGFFRRPAARERRHEITLPAGSASADR